VSTTEIINFISLDIEKYPHWAQLAIPHLKAIALIMVLIYIIARIGHTSEFKNVMRRGLNIGVALGRFLRKEMTDPTESKKPSRIALYYAMIQAYFLSAGLALYFVVITLLWAFTNKNLSLLEHFQIGGWCILTVIMARVLKAEGGRQLDKIRKL